MKNFDLVYFFKKSLKRWCVGQDLLVQQGEVCPGLAAVWGQRRRRVDRELGSKCFASV